MKAVSQVCIVAALILASAASLYADSTLKGVVADSTGGVIANAIVRIHWDSAGAQMGIGNVGVKEDVVIRTDANGTFSVNLPPGFYDVFVSSPAFRPVCTKIRAHAGKVVTFNSKLDVSAVLIAEIGTRVSAEPK